MKKAALYIAGFVLISIVLVYFLNEVGLVASIFGGSFVATKKLNDEANKYIRQKEEIEEEIARIRKSKENLKVKDKTPEEEVDYWKKQ